MSLLNQRYQLEKPLGEGGFGKTYLAQDTQSQKRCVVKQLKIQHMDKWDSVKAFEKEAQILASLSHPKIPNFFDAFEYEADGQVTLYLVHEFIEGDSFKDLRKKDRVFKESEIIEIAVQICDILIYLHSLSPPVIHRDLKPSNLILNPQNKVFMIDFGAVKSSLQSDSLNPTSIGTFGYMPPEQYEGKATEISDLYGLGATLVYLLSGKEPGEMELFQLRPHIEVHLNISDNLMYILTTLLNADAEKRFPSARALKTKFQALQKGENIVPSPQINVKKWLIGSLFLIGSLLLGLLVFVVGINIAKMNQEVYFDKAIYEPWEPMKIKVHNTGVKDIKVLLKKGKTSHNGTPYDWHHLDALTKMYAYRRPNPFEKVIKSLKSQEFLLCAPHAQGEYALEVERVGDGSRTYETYPFKVKQAPSHFPSVKIKGLKKEYPNFGVLDYVLSYEDTPCRNDIWQSPSLAKVTVYNPQTQKTYSPLKRDDKYYSKNERTIVLGAAGDVEFRVEHPFLPTQYHVKQPFKVYSEPIKSQEVTAFNYEDPKESTQKAFPKRFRPEPKYYNNRIIDLKNDSEYKEWYAHYSRYFAFIAGAKKTLIDSQGKPVSLIERKGFNKEHCFPEKPGKYQVLLNDVITGDYISQYTVNLKPYPIDVYTFKGLKDSHGNLLPTNQTTGPKVPALGYIGLKIAKNSGLDEKSIPECHPAHNAGLTLKTFQGSALVSQQTLSQNQNAVTPPIPGLYRFELYYNSQKIGQSNLVVIEHPTPKDSIESIVEKKNIPILSTVNTEYGTRKFHGDKMYVYASAPGQHSQHIAVVLIPQKELSRPAKDLFQKYVVQKKGLIKTPWIKDWEIHRNSLGLKGNIHYGLKIDWNPFKQTTDDTDHLLLALYANKGKAVKVFQSEKITLK